MTYDEAVQSLIYPSPGPSWLARRLGIEPQGVTGWFQDGKRVPVKRDIDIATAFGVDPAELRKGRIKYVASPVRQAAEVNAEPTSYLLKTAEDRALLAIWDSMGEDAKLVAIDVMDAIARLSRPRAA